MIECEKRHPKEIEWRVNREGEALNDDFSRSIRWEHKLGKKLWALREKEKEDSVKKAQPTRRDEKKSKKSFEPRKKNGATSQNRWEGEMRCLIEGSR